MSHILTDTLVSDWRYVSEGGATIVFSYIGAANPFFDGTVLRLRKCLLGAVQEDRGDEPDDPTIEFQNVCMQRLIPPEHLPRMESVFVGDGSEEWLEALAALAEPDRAPERRRKDCIDVKHRKAVLATDLVGGQGFAVEIKPKWGFLPSPTHLSAATLPVKTRTCRFCMHSHMKAKEGESVALGYCPLDLFSGDEARVKKALASLWAAWTQSDGAANNLKVFVEGRRISPSAQALLGEDPEQVFASALLPILTTTPVLHTLSRLQRTLDALDVEGLAPLWDLAPVGTDPSIDEWSAFISEYLAAPTQPPPADAAHLRYHVMAYLLSASFKDCSIILRVPDGTATVIDLDPKSVDRLRKWERLDAEIVAAYAAVPDPRVCADQDSAS